MFELPVEITARSVRLTITAEQYHKIDAVDDQTPSYNECLGGKLDKLQGVCNYDMNGHFGLYIFLTLEAEHDTLDKFKEIFDVIEAHMNIELIEYSEEDDE